MKQDRSKNYTNRLYNPLAKLNQSQMETRGKTMWPSAKPSGTRAKPRAKRK